FFGKSEHAEAMRRFVLTVQRIEAAVQPYRKTWALRLFTERQALSRFSPQLVNEALRQLRELVEQLGSPPGWRGGELPPREDAQAGRRKRVAGPGSSVSRPPAPERPVPPFAAPPPTALRLSA
ncbi:MAG: hypothetical protein V3S29_11620, partial [bacterium]